MRYSVTCWLVFLVGGLAMIGGGIVSTFYPGPTAFAILLLTLGTAFAGISFIGLRIEYEIKQIQKRRA